MTETDPTITENDDATEEQIDIGISNCKTIFDPNNKINEQLLFSMMELEFFAVDPLVLHALVTNTAQVFFEKMGGDENENLGSLQLICDYIKNSQNKQELAELSSRAFNMICSPINYKENAAFIQVWGDILNKAIQWKYPEWYAESI